jgi:microcystin-dependent protein
MRGRTPIHVSNTHSQGQKSGEETHSLSEVEMPQHKHLAQASSADASVPIPTNNMLAKTTLEAYGNKATSTAVAMNSASISNQGGGQGHENMQPFIVLNYCIALQGLFPSRN